jgi:predicted MFS family arabinose efflux permease
MTTSASTLLPGRAWFAVVTAGLATFTVVTTEMLPVGLLTPIAQTLESSTGTAGLMISLPALLAALFAPCVVIASGGVDRRHILGGLLGVLVFANIAAALASNMFWMLAARILVGFCMGGIWAIAGGLAMRLVSGSAVGLATSIIFGGVAAASVLGVPLGALIGEVAGWRWAFGAMALFSTLVLILHLVVMPALPVKDSVRVHQFVSQITRRQVQTGALLTLLLVAGHFVMFTFVQPLLMNMSGFQAQWLSALLLVYGIAGMVGNFVAGIFAARHTVMTLICITSGLLLTPLLYLMAGQTSIGAGLVLILWGLAYGGVSVGLMTWMMHIAPRAVEVVSALYVAVFNIGIALGAWMGGQIVDQLGLLGNLWMGVVCAGAALLLCAYIRQQKSDSP